MLQIEHVPAARTYAIRRATLRMGIADAPVTHPDDERPESFHLLARVDGADAGVVSCAPGAMKESGRDGWRLYQMGVLEHVQGRGVGRALVEQLIERVRALEGVLVWAMARDNAQGFYVSCGFTVVGDQYLGWNDIPHHTVFREL